MMNTRANKIVLIAFLLSLLPLTTILAQVSIAPTALFFNEQTRFSAITVSNGGNQTQEISISADFGFPTSENGNFVISSDSAVAEEYSMADWINVFPASFTLGPQQRQVVRFVLRPPAQLEDKGYWARVKVSSNPETAAIETVGNDQVGAQINIILEQVIGAHYHTRNAATGVAVNNVDFDRGDDGNSGTINIDIERTGNAPFVGSLNFQIIDSDGNTVYQTNATTSVYTNIRRTYAFDISQWPAGTYKITGNIVSERRDIDPSYLLQIDPVSFEQEFEIE
ncbi:hypothetical protein AB2B38_012670 [Balneola sp. MJW-20]|uniref:hypothetical protein n=1 Tax=Gracilimonas aurantiaca TaxID=3234185 RepID=UPI00346657AB